MNKYALVLKALDIVIESRLWNDKKPSEVLNILMYLHTKGWLYTPLVDGKVQAVVAAYRIKDGSNLMNLPLKEEGNILYIPFVLSIDNNIGMFRIMREIMKSYLNDNPDVTEILLEGKDDRLRRYKIGAKNGFKQRAESTSNANVSN